MKKIQRLSFPPLFPWRGTAGTLADSRLRGPIPALWQNRRPHRNRRIPRWIRSPLWLGLFLAATLAGCTSARVAPAVSPYASPEIALRSLAATDVKGPITATARIEIRRFGQRYPAKLALMLQKPARLRLESIPLFGPPDLFLSIDGDELRVFIPERGAFYRGKATATNLSRFFPLALPAADIVSLLLGQLPEEETASALQGEMEEGLYRVERYAGGEKTGSCWIDPAEDRLVRFQKGTEGESAALTAEFADPIRLGAAIMPQQVILGGGGGTLTIRYTEIRLSEDDRPAFALPIPEGVTATALD
ncbi:MAG: DUF4292 domain-containing protein [Deltaproteobacteria bacterium]|nr:DUF4292 domain-containing protein [Deltaproteobacteria bacterium]